MSTTPSSSASVNFFGPPESLKITPKASDDYTWLTISHEAFEKCEEDDPHGRLPAHIEVEATLWGSAAELRAFALRMVAAVEAEWPEAAPQAKS